MPVVDRYSEVLIAITIGIFILFVIAALVVFLFVYYQKKRFQHKGELDQLEKKFSEALFRSQLEIQEQAFNHISGEIHDNVGQILSLARIQINIITETSDKVPPLLVEVKNNVGLAIEDLRGIARSLSSERLQYLAIHESVAEEADRINKSGVTEFSVLVEGEPCLMEEHKKLILFRIIQEGLQNCLKHAEAGSVQINFCYNPSALQVTIADDGKGFDMVLSLPRMGMGLSNMRNRAALAGGSSLVESTPGKGTTIKIQMPYA